MPAENTNWALVTGASAGIGAEFCRQLAARSWSLVLVARREDRLEELAKSLQNEYSSQCKSFALDLSDHAAPQTLQDRLSTEGIEIGFLVNNAGYGVPGAFNHSAWQTHADSLQVMLNSVCELCWRFLPGMQAQKNGYIINVASVAGLVPGSAGHTLYGAMKSFLIRFSESLAAENAGTGVKVSALCPGFTYSEFHDVTRTRELVQQMPDYMWMTAEEVVHFGLESALREQPRVIAIPGRVNRFIATLTRLMPRRLAQWLTRRQAHRFRSAESQP